MAENKDNLKLWDKVEKTDPGKTKKVDFGGNKYTAIDPYYRIKNATKELGMYGEKWGFRDVEIKELKLNDENWMAVFKGVFFYEFENKKGEFPISSSSKLAYMTNGGKGYLKVDDDYAKKIYTDALTKALSYLGFNADIFMGKFEDEKYVAEMKKVSADVAEERLVQLDYELKACATAPEVTILYQSLEKNEKVNKIVLEKFSKRTGELKPSA